MEEKEGKPENIEQEMGTEEGETKGRKGAREGKEGKGGGRRRARGKAAPAPYPVWVPLQSPCSSLM